MKKHLLIVSIALLSLMTSNVFGLAATIWNGGDGDWMDPCMWSAGVPDDTKPLPDTVCYHTVASGTATMSTATPKEQWCSLGAAATGFYAIEMVGSATHTITQGLYLQGSGGTAPADAVTEFNVRDSAVLTLDGTTQGGYPAYIQTGQFAGGTSNIGIYDNGTINCLGNGVYLGDNGNIATLTVAQNGTLNTQFIGVAGLNGPGVGTVNISGNATVNLSLYLTIANLAGATGVVNMSSGNLTCGGQVWVGNDGDGTLNMTGGLIDCNDVSVAIGAASSGVINLDGGLIVTHSLNLNAAGQLLVTNGGMIVLGKDLTGTGTGDLDWWSLTGQFVGSAYFDGANTIIGTIPEPATMALLALGALAIRRRK